MANLTGKQLVEQGIITGLIAEENIAQHGVDLNLVSVEKIIGKGFVPRVGKTKIAIRRNIEPGEIEVDGEKTIAWHLEPGSYDITFAQGCNIPSDQMLLIRQRSSLLRNGAILHSSCFDAGFETQQIGTVLHVRVPIIIEVGARVAQIYAHHSNVVENLYNGQFQGDIQRTQK
jgi:deoxycytidine triphosphate deaminase